MSGIGGISGFGGIGPSAGIGMAGLSGAASIASSPIAAQATSGAVSSMTLSPNMQSVVQALEQFSTAEILFMLMAASRRREQQPVCGSEMIAGMAVAALIGQGSPVTTTFESSMTVPVMAGGTLNVSG